MGIRDFLEKFGSQQRKQDRLIKEVGHGKVERARAIVQGGADTNWVCPYDNHLIDKTPLGIAALEDRVDMIRMLVEAGADVNLVAGSDHVTALMWAAGEAPRRVQCTSVAALLKAGADPNLAKVDGYTPLILACTAYAYGQGVRRLLAARHLIEAGADVNAVTVDGETALSKLLAEFNGYDLTIPDVSRSEHGLRIEHDDIRDLIDALRQAGAHEPTEAPTSDEATRDTEEAQREHVLMDELVGLGPRGFLEGAVVRTKEIGAELHEIGGMALMLEAHRQVQLHASSLVQASELEHAWHGIGEWQA